MSDDISAETRTICSITQHTMELKRVMHLLTSELEQRAIVHDQSKWSDVEFPALARINHTARHHKFGSPEYRQAVRTEKPAMDHHMAHNDHHPEYWFNASGDAAGVQDMRFLQIIEMVCDWWAAWRVYEQSKVPEQRSTWSENLETQRTKFEGNGWYTDRLWHVVQEVGWWIEGRVSL